MERSYCITTAGSVLYYSKDRPLHINDKHIMARYMAFEYDLKSNEYIYNVILYTHSLTEFHIVDIHHLDLGMERSLVGGISVKGNVSSNVLKRLTLPLNTNIVHIGCSHRTYITNFHKVLEYNPNVSIEIGNGDRW